MTEQIKKPLFDTRFNRILPDEQCNRFIELIQDEGIIKQKRKKSIKCFFRFLMNLLIR